MRIRPALCAVFAVLVSGCVVPVLVPTGVAVRSGSRDVAFTEAGGVRVWADGTWSGDPANLPDYVTPVLVTVENRSGRAVRLAYEDFTLLGATGTRYAALPPFSISGPVSDATVRPGTIVLADYHPARPVPQRPVSPRIHSHRFHVAPPYAHLYIGFPLWAGLWALNAAYYAHWSAMWPTLLPTDDMLQRAMPEGALEDGGVVSGYVYFQNVNREATVQLEVQLHDAASAASMGVAAIPFSVRR